MVTRDQRDAASGLMVLLLRMVLIAIFVALLPFIQIGRGIAWWHHKSQTKQWPHDIVWCCFILGIVAGSWVLS